MTIIKALIAALAAVSIFGGVQTWRIGELKDDIVVLNERVANRDDLIKQQNAGITSLTKQRDEDRAAYEAGLRSANRQAANLEAAADHIMSLPVPPVEQQCDAALDVLMGETE